MYSYIHLIIRLLLDSLVTQFYSVNLTSTSNLEVKSHERSYI